MNKLSLISLLLSVIVLNTQVIGQQLSANYQEPELGIELLDVLDYVKRFPTDCDFVASHPKDPYNFSYILPTYTNYLDPIEAIPACEAAFAERSDLRNAYLLGRSYDIAEQYDKAFIYLKAAAERGYRIAQNNLGVLYFEGFGIPQDLEKAAYWYRQSASQGDQVAQSNLGVLYREGLGVPQDMDTAFMWFELAARTRDWYAQFNIGFMYLNGFSVEQDYQLAYDWFMVSARQNYAPAMFQLGEMHRLGLNEPADETRALYWYNLAADLGSEEAETILSQIQTQRANR